VNREHEELARRVDDRLARIETKLDVYLERLTQHDTDLQWVRGYIRLSLSTMIALGVGIITALFKLFLPH